MHKKISTNLAPMAIGPYSQAIVSQGTHLLFISGQIPLDAKTLKISSTNVREQTITVLKNLQAILEAAGARTESVVKTTVFLKSMEDFATVNEEYKKFFVEHKPARACVEVSRLPKDVLIEIEAIAVF